MNQLIDEPIDVLAAFPQQKPTPLLFRWQGKRYRVAKTHLIHSTKEGYNKVYYFSVSDTANYFKLRFDTNTLKWRLMELYTD